MASPKIAGDMFRRLVEILHGLSRVTVEDLNFVERCDGRGASLPKAGDGGAVAADLSEGKLVFRTTEEALPSSAEERW